MLVFKVIQISETLKTQVKLNHNFCRDPMQLLVSHTEGRIYSNIITVSQLADCSVMSYLLHSLYIILKLASF